MSTMYAPGSVKRQKTAREPNRVAEATENFQGINYDRYETPSSALKKVNDTMTVFTTTLIVSGRAGVWIVPSLLSRRQPSKNHTGIGKIEYKPDSPHSTEDFLFYRYYNAAERIHGRSMEDWIRPSVFLGRCFTPYPGCIQRPWSETQQTLDNYKKSIRAMFEMCLKLGIKYWSGYDRDMAPEGDTFEETQSNFDQVVDYILEYQQKTGVRPLWLGIDFKNNARYKNGATTNSDSNIVAYAAYQMKKALDAAHKLNAECFLFSGEQEGYDNVFNTDMKKEMKHYARFLKMIIDQRDKIGYRGQLLIQTSFENAKPHGKYNRDLFSTLAFLKHYNYDHYFKCNVRIGHDFFMSNVSLGSVDIRDDYLTDTTQAVLMLKTIIENGGISSGGLTFYVPSYDGPFDAKDLMECYITALDAFAKALRISVKLVNDAQINKSIQTRYANFTSGWGAKFMSSESALEECEEYAKKLIEAGGGGSNRADHWSNVLTRYVDAPLK